VRETTKTTSATVDPIRASALVLSGLRAMGSLPHGRGPNLYQGVAGPSRGVR
jgi:hypothetical protein